MKVIRACVADEKERMACAIHKLKVVVHVVVFAVGLLEAKNAWGSGESRFFKRPMQRTKTNRANKRSDRSEQSEVNGSFYLRLGVQKVVFLRVKCDGLICNNVIPTEGGKHFAKTVS